MRSLQRLLSTTPTHNNYQRTTHNKHPKRLIIHKLNIVQNHVKRLLANHGNNLIPVVHYASLHTPTLTPLRQRHLHQRPNRLVHRDVVAPQIVVLHEVRRTLAHLHLVAQQLLAHALEHGGDGGLQEGREVQRRRGRQQDLHEPDQRDDLRVSPRRDDHLVGVAARPVAEHEEVEGRDERGRDGEEGQRGGGERLRVLLDGVARPHTALHAAQQAFRSGSVLLKKLGCEGRVERHICLQRLEMKQRGDSHLHEEVEERHITMHAAHLLLDGGEVVYS